MKTILEFGDQEEDRALDAIHGTQYRMWLSKIQEHVRQIRKYEDHNDDATAVLDDIYDFICLIMEQIPE